VLGAGCELVLGELPPVGKPDGGTGASSSTASTGAGGASSTAASSSSAASSGATGTGGCCDCDHDTYAAEGLCGGMDCDDTDKRVYPGEPIYYAVPSPNVGFDWDCSGTVEPDPMLNVAVDCNTLPLPCPSTTGFLMTTPPPCGQSGPWGTCKQSGLSCVNDVVVTAQVMTCK
jgi:hypothetical protein